MLRILKPKRRAFTLVELLVVIGIIVVLASLAVLILDSTSTHRAASRGADQLQGWLAQGKTLALRDQLPRGVRLVRSTTNPNWITGVVFLEQPDNYVPFAGTNTLAQLTVPAWVDPAPNANSIQVTVNNLDITGDVSQYDMLEFTTGTETAHRITSISGNGSSTTMTLGSLVGSAYGTNLVLNFNGVNTGGYRFIRQPRPLLGEPMMELPKGVVIDLSLSINIPVSYTPDPYWGLPYTTVDIVFSQSGQVIGATGGRVVLASRYQWSRRQSGGRADLDDDLCPNRAYRVPPPGTGEQSLSIHARRVEFGAMMR